MQTYNRKINLCGYLAPTFYEHFSCPCFYVLILKFIFYRFPPPSRKLMISESQKTGKGKELEEKKGREGKERGKGKRGTFYRKSLFFKIIPNTFTAMLPGSHLSVTLPRFRNRVISGGFSAPGCRMLLKFKK